MFMSETETKQHAEEAQAMHLSLKGTKVGRGVSEFIVQTCAAKMTGANETSICKVLELSKALLTTLNTKDGLEKTGFVNERRNMPNFIILADLMGKRVSTWSDTPTLIRELCASFYGPTVSNIGHGNIIRHEIDNEVKLAADSPNTSLCLVLVSPWGESISDRFWRLMTIRKTENGAFLDSERFLTSIQSPPARPGCSVLGNQMSEIVSPRMVEAFCSEWKAFNIEMPVVCQAVDSNGAGADNRQLVVLKGVLNQLKSENSRLTQALDLLKESKEAEIQTRVESKLVNERVLFYRDVEDLNQTLESQARCVSIERIRADVIASAMKEADAALSKSLDFIQDLKGELLLKEDVISCSKKAKSDECEKLRDLLKKSKAEIKRLETSRKEEIQHRLEEKAKRIELESSLEDQRSVNEMLNNELQESKDREQRFRDTASEQTARLFDDVENKAGKIKELEKRICETVYSTSKINERYKTILCRALLSHRVALRFRLKLKALVEKTKSDNALSTTSVETACAKEVSIKNTQQMEYFPADAVAAAHSTISMLKRFVEIASDVTPKSPDIREHRYNGNNIYDNGHQPYQQHYYHAQQTFYPNSPGFYPQYKGNHGR